MLSMLSTLAVLLVLSNTVYSHGRLRKPLSRSSMWRDIDDPAVAPYANIIVANYNDKELFCGGFQHQQSLGGKCGVCGDPYDGVRDNEAGGKYAKGIITRQYEPGSWIDVHIEMTAHHLGYFEFRLCPWNKPTVPITQDCLDQFLLENDTPASPKWMLPSPDSSDWYYSINVSLPQELECDQCVLQWKYHAGNSWGCDPDRTCGLGYGPQEEFYGCADVAIGTGATLAPPNTVLTTTESTTTTTGSNVVTTSTTAQTTTTTTTSSGTNPCANGGSEYIMNDCTSFYKCSNNQAFLFNCPAGTVYNDPLSICDFPYNVPPPCDTVVV